METYGKGKSYTRTEAVPSLHSPPEFKEKFGLQFSDFCRHILPSWFLTNTKLEVMKPLLRRSHCLVIVTDFAENVTVRSKHELAEQYFHQPEILVFGGVASFLIQPQDAAARDPDLGQDNKLFCSSFIVSSDYR